MDKREHTRQTLTDIAKGIQYTVNAAQDLVEKFYIGLLDRYFDKDNDPITMSVNISEDTTVEVPLITLVTPTGLELDELEVDMSLRVDGVRTKKVITRSGDEVERASFDISFSGAGKSKVRNPNFIEMKMKFKKADAPEGIQRIIENFSNNVIPKDK